MQWQTQVDWSNLIPFVLATGQHQRVSVVRIVESLIIAVVTAGFVMYATQQVMVEQMNSLRGDLEEVKIQIDKIHADFYAPRLPRGSNGD